MQTSAPLPSVSARMASTGSPSETSTVWVAPMSLAHSSFFGSRSTAITLVAPASTAPTMAASPTPPQPNTATLSPCSTPPVWTAAPIPAITPHPSSPATSGRTSERTFVHWPAATRVSSAKAPMPSAGLRGSPSSVIFCAAFRVAKQYCGRPRRHERHRPHTARQLRMTKSPGATSSTPSPTDSTTPAASWPSRKGKSWLMAPSR